MDILRVSNLTKRFKQFVAVDNISFTLKEGEILGLLGPNGAGKTTTIQMLLGVLTPTSGDIAYFDKPFLANKETVLEQINFSSTYTNLPWDFSVFECLLFISYLYAIADRKQRIAEIVKTFQLEPLIKQKITELSAGQLTRVNLAKAFLNHPKVLLLDEPTASLDPDVANYIREFLLKERSDRHVSIIITSHNMAEVEALCDRVIFINHGKIIADDTPKALAKTIRTAHLTVLPTGSIEAVTNYCKAQGLNCTSTNDYVTVDVPEHEIAKVLEGLAKAKISYDEISIEKPSLEDYFLQVSGRRNINEIT